MRSELLDRIFGVTHGFGTVAAPVPAPFTAVWEARKPQWVQVHKTDFCEVSRSGQECGEVDALWSRAPGILVAARHADCVPVLMARRDGKAVAAVHAGWRGTRAHILRELWAGLQTQGEKPQEWVATVGPAIGPCCYEVSEELALDFAREFGPGAVPRPRHLDLPAINAAELREIGVSEIETLRSCTQCSVDARGQPLFHSYRREKTSTRQFSVIAIGTFPAHS
jgi:YfiH family protein